MAVPANAAVRESRRKATAQEWERMNVLKALTAAEHSRRQFILNFAASRDTALLVPGHKADAVKAAEEWVAVWFSQSGYDRVDNEFFKYTVDARLWATHGMSPNRVPALLLLTDLQWVMISTSRSHSCAERPTSPQDQATTPRRKARGAGRRFLAAVRLTPTAKR